MHQCKKLARIMHYICVQRGIIMTQIQITLNNKAGLHARPAGLLVRLLNEYKSEVTVEKNGRNVNCKA